MNLDYIVETSAKTKARLQALKRQLAPAEHLIYKKACVYATGSFGRLEAGPYSDLDLFIVVDVLAKNKKRRLDGIGEIKLKYHLISAVENLGIAPFDGDGKFLASHGINDFCEALGSRHDDYNNTLTGRLLMLLESQPLLGEAVFKRALDNVVGGYFRDYDDHANSFVPAFLINDILRMWRTFCVNYEFYRKREKPDWKVKNLKLKFSRMLTCYSAVIYLLDLFSRKRSVSPEDVKLMVSLTPIARLQVVNEISGDRDDIAKSLDKALELYSSFLELTHLPKVEMLQTFAEQESDWRQLSYSFGAHLVSVIETFNRKPDSLFRRVII